MKYKYINDVFDAGNVGEAVGHPVRIMTIRLLRESKDKEMTIMDLLNKIKSRYNYNVPYGTFVAHIHKLEIEGIVKTSKMGKFKSLKLLKDIEVIEVMEDGKR